MFAEIAELFLCKIFQIVIKFMNQNKLLSQRQHQGRAWTWLDWARAFNLEASLLSHKIFYETKLSITAMEQVL